MRVTTIVAVCLLIGMAIGIGITWVEFRSAINQFEPSNRNAAMASSEICQTVAPLRLKALVA